MWVLFCFLFSPFEALIYIHFLSPRIWGRKEFFMKKTVVNEQATQVAPKKTVTVKVSDLYARWADKGNIHPDIKLMLGSNLPGAPLIKEATLQSILNLSPLALYLAYLGTWGEQNQKTFRFHSPNVGEDVAAVEENACKNYAILRKDDEGNFELTGQFGEVPVVAAKILIEVLASEDLVRNLHKTMSEISRHWKETDKDGNFVAKDDWKKPGSPVNSNLLGFSLAIEDLFKNGELSNVEIEYYKGQTQEDVTLDVGCEKSFGLLHNAKSEAEFTTADSQVAERLLHIPPKADFATAMTAIHLISEEEMFEDVSYMVPSINEPRYKNGYSLQRWEYVLIRGVAYGIYRNAIIYGPSGTGKSTSTRTLALALGLPCYPAIICSSDTTKEDLLGSYHMNRDNKLEYLPSSLMLAVRYGGVVELQEPSNIRNQGLLTALNNVLDPCGFIQIPETGEYFERHKHCVIVLTTNQDYVGCKNITQSVLSRMTYSKRVEDLSEEELVRRVKFEPSCILDDEFLRLMASTFTRLCETFVEESMYGVEDYRTFLGWVEETGLEGDAIVAAESTLVDKMSFSSDKDAKQKLRDTITAMIQNRKPKIDKKRQPNHFKKELDAIFSLVEREPKKKD